MTTKHQPYITLESVIQDYMTEGDIANQKYFKIFNLAFRGMEQMGLDAFYKVQAVKPKPNNLCRPFPR
jgi:hypothetical protein